MEEKKSKKGLWFGLAGGVLAVILIIILLLTQCTGPAPVELGFEGPQGSGRLAQQLAKPGNATITVNSDVVLDGYVVVVGNKTIVGTGTITLSVPMGSNWPEDSGSGWSTGCAALEAADAQLQAVALTVTKGASLTLEGSVTLDAAGNANAVLVQDNAQFTLKGEATVQNGRYANLVVSKLAQANLAGGQLLNGKIYNVINYGTTQLEGSLVSGAEDGAAIYTTGQLEQSGGRVENAAKHNVYVAEGSFRMSGGENSDTPMDNILVAQGASAEVTGGSVSYGNHGLCNNGTAFCGAVTFEECGLMNNKDAVLTLEKTTVDTSVVYNLANNGGTVEATDFTAKGCDTCAVYNFTGDMKFTNLTVEGSRDGNVSNAGGNMEINGATLGMCRDKSITVGGGKAVFKDVKVLGTTNEKYGVYAYGGELILQDSSIEEVSSTAVKLDAGATVTLQNVTIYNAAQNGFQNDGGKLEATKVSMEKLGSHGIYNNGGEVIAKELSVKDVAKNGIQHRSGTTTVDGISLSGTGNHGAYLENGTLTVKNGIMEDMAANGFYVPQGESELMIEGLTISGAVQQGINNNAKVTVKNSTIQNTGKNGIYNKVPGTVTVSGLTVVNPGEHGINNKSQMTVSNVTVRGSGNGSNGIQNNGTMQLSGATVSDSRNHGIYNTGSLTAAQVTISGTEDNGVYNDKGNASFNGLTVTHAGAQGVNNNATVSLKNVTVVSPGKNGVYNSKGTAAIDGLVVRDAKEHGLNNVAEMTAANVTVTGSGKEKNSVQNSGKLTLTKAQLNSSSNHGIYNKGTLTGSDITIDKAAKNGLYNDKGTVKGLEKLTVTGAGEQGINNTGTLEAKGISVDGTGKNGIYNADGSAALNDVTVKNTAEHGINNIAQMTASQVNISATGEGKNSVQNGGTLSLNAAQLTGSQNHGIYNNGTLSGSKVTVNKTSGNGLYNDKGLVSGLEELTVIQAGEQGINNTGDLTAQKITVEKAGKNGIYNAEGKANITGLEVKSAAEHGVNNTGTLTATNVSVTGTGESKNSVQNSGTVTLTDAKLVASKNHGIYNNGTLSGSQITVSDAQNNGLYNDKGTVTDLRDLTVVNPKNQGINNTGTLSASQISVSGSGKNGMFNNGGTATVTGLKVTGAGEHGVSNDNEGSLTLVDANISGSGTGSNNIQNKATLNLNNVTLSGSSNHGIYNDSLINGQGTLTVSGAAVNGIYNYKGTVIHTGTVAVSQPGSHGFNNAGEAQLNVITVASSAENGLHNQGVMTVTGSAELTNLGKHGIYNGKEMDVSNVTVKNAGDLFINNGGQLIVRTASLSGTANKAIYNSGYGELYGVSLDATQVYNNSNSAQQWLVDCNAGGYLDLCDSTIQKAAGTAVQIRGSSDVSLTNVIIDHAGNYGVFVEKNSTLSGDGVVINHIIKGFDGAEGMGIKSQGQVAMLDHATLGGYDDSVTGSGAALVSTQNSGIYNNAINIDGGTFSGYDIVIANQPTSGNGIYCKGDMYVTDLSVEGGNSAIAVRYQGWVTLSGKVSLKNSKNSPIRIFGDESNQKCKNGVTLTENSRLDIDGCGGHAINNKGTFDAQANTDITIKNVVGANTNAVQNNGSKTNNGGPAIMNLYNVTVEGLTTTRKDNATNVNNGICNSGTLTLNGLAQVSGIKEGAELTHTETSIYAGVMNKGTFTGSGSIVVGKEGVEDDTFVGVYNSGAKFDIKGTVTVYGAEHYGVQNNGKPFTAGGITVKNVHYTPDNRLALGIRNGGGANAKMTINGDVLIDGVTAPQATGIQNEGSCTLTLNGNTVIRNITSTGIPSGTKGVGNGLRNTGIVDLNGKLTVEDVVTTGQTDNTNRAGIVCTGKITNTGSGVGSIVIGSEQSTNKFNNGIFLQKNSLSIKGDIEIYNTTGRGLYAADPNASVTANHIKVVNAGNNAILVNKDTGSLTAADITVINPGNHGIEIVGKMQAGNIRVENGVGSGKNAVYVNGAKASLTCQSITVTGTKGTNGIYVNNSAGKVTVADVTVSDVTGNGIYSKGSFTSTGVLNVSDVKGDASIPVKNEGAMTLTGGTVTDSAAGCSIYNTGDLKLMGKLTVGNIVTADNTAKGSQGLRVDGSADVTAANISLTNVAGNGVYLAKGKLTVTGTLAIDGTQNHGINNKGTLEAANIDIKNVGKSGSESHGLNNDGTLISSVKISVANVPNGRGISQNSTLEAKDVSVTNVTGGAGLITKGTVTAQNITVENIYGTQQGVQLNGATAVLTADNISVTNATGNGVYVNNAAGQLIVADTLTVDKVNQHGLNNAGLVTVANASISNVGQDGNERHGVNNNGGSITGTGTFTVTNVPKGNGISSNRTLNLNNVTVTQVVGFGILNKGTATVNGNANISDISGDNTASVSNQNVLTLTGGTIADSASGCSIHNTGDLKILGALTVGNVISTENSAKGTQGLRLDGSADMTAANISITNVAGNGLYLAKGKLTVTGTLAIDGTQNHGINNKGTLEAATVDIKNVGSSGSESHGINNDGTLISSVKISVANVPNGRGISQNSTLEAKDVSVTNVTGGHGINSKNSFTATGTVTVSDVNGAFNGFNNVGTANINRLEISDVGTEGTAHNVGAGLCTEGNVTVTYLSVDGSLRHGVYVKNNAVCNVTTARISNAGQIGMLMEGGTWNGTMFWIYNANGQGIQTNNQVNTLKLETLVVDTLAASGGNALRLYNSGKKTLVVDITTMAVRGVGNWAITAQNKDNATVTVDNLYYPDGMTKLVGTLDASAVANKAVGFPVTDPASAAN